jgi:hypothetical protein
MRSTERASGFHVLPFAIDGASVGKGYWEESQLSQHWLSFCRDFLKGNGPALERSLPGNLSDIGIKFTSGSGAALLTLTVQGRLIVSSVMVSGHSPTADAEVARMFVESLTRMTRGRVPELQNVPFSDLLTAAERPLIALVHWPDDNVTEDLDEMIRELTLHFAGAFFSPPQGE